MRLLVLGGTVFLGRAIVGCALSRGHEVSLFHRGRSNPGLFPNAHEVFGDRDEGLAGLEGETWDVVIDTCGYVPRIVRQSAEALSGRVRQYIFISSISVYADTGADILNEDSRLGSIANETTEEITGETYGPLKVLCERSVKDIFKDNALIIRPGLIVGPWDKSDRFTYWPVKMASGGPVLIPNRLDQPVQFIDVRDLAEWTIQMAEGSHGGVFNATGPAAGLDLGSFLRRCNAVTGGSATLTPVSTTALELERVQPWSDLPLVLPYDGSGDGMGRANVRKALALGLRFRPTEETLQDTLTWYMRERGKEPLRAGLSRERELEILEAYQDEAGNNPAVASSSN